MRTQDFWHVDAVYLDPRWLADQDPLADFAVARVSRGRRRIGRGRRSAAGLALGSPPRGRAPTVDRDRLSDRASGAARSAARAHDGRAGTGIPSLPCAGLVDGTSGAPWLAGSTVIGSVGGLDGGGCEENVSYSPPFDGAIARLLARAEAGGPGDAAPAAFDDDC